MEDMDRSREERALGTPGCGASLELRARLDDPLLLAPMAAKRAPDPISARESRGGAIPQYRGRVRANTATRYTSTEKLQWPWGAMVMISAARGGKRPQQKTSDQPAVAHWKFFRDELR